jgi:hypothetical protein
MNCKGPKIEMIFEEVFLSLYLKRSIVGKQMILDCLTLAKAIKG